MVGEEGLEPSRHCCQQILSLSCIPISPLAQCEWIGLFYHKKALCARISAMDNQKGGQKSTPAAPSWNAWSKAAGMKMQMENASGRSNSQSSGMTRLQKQQQTATALARKKVLEAYGATAQKQDYKEPTASSPVPQATSQDWRKYHSASHIFSMTGNVSDFRDSMRFIFCRTFSYSSPDSCRSRQRRRCCRHL